MDIFVTLVIAVITLAMGWTMRDFWIAINPGKRFRGLFGDFVAVPESKFISLDEHLKVVADMDERLNESLSLLSTLTTQVAQAAESSKTEVSTEPKKTRAPRKSRSKAVGKLSVETVSEENKPSE